MRRFKQRFTSSVNVWILLGLLPISAIQAEENPKEVLHTLQKVQKVATKGAQQCEQGAKLNGYTPCEGFTEGEKLMYASQFNVKFHCKDGYTKQLAFELKRSCPRDTEHHSFNRTVSYFKEYHPGADKLPIYPTQLQWWYEQRMNKDVKELIQFPPSGHYHNQAISDENAKKLIELYEGSPKLGPLPNCGKDGLYVTIKASCTMNFEKENTALYRDLLKEIHQAAPSMSQLKEQERMQNELIETDEKD